MKISEFLHFCQKWQEKKETQQFVFILKTARERQKES